MTINWTATPTSAATIPGRGIDAWVRTIRNAYKAAARDGQARYVGTTYTSYFITDNINPVEGPHVQLRVDADGTVYKKAA